MKDKETALQWLLCEPLEWIVDKTDGSQIIRFPKGSIEKAKEIEKEQIIDALLFGDVLSPNTAETYYKQTYGDNK